MLVIGGFGGLQGLFLTWAGLPNTTQQTNFEGPGLLQLDLGRTYERFPVALFVIHHYLYGVALSERQEFCFLNQSFLTSRQGVVSKLEAWGL